MPEDSPAPEGKVSPQLPPPESLNAATAPESFDPDSLLIDESGVRQAGTELNTAAELELQRITFNRPKWITSDAQLRDEGVSYGMGLRGEAGLTPEAVQRKLAAIAGWYAVRERVVATRIRQLDERIAEIAPELERAADDEREHREALAAVTPVAFAPKATLRQVGLRAVGLTASVLTFGTFLTWWFAAAYVTATAVLMAAVVVLLAVAGTAPTYTVLLTDEAEPARRTWKRLVEQLGLPLIGTLILVAMSYETWAPFPLAAAALATLFVGAFLGRAAAREYLRLPGLLDEQRRARHDARLGEETRARHRDGADAALLRRRSELPTRRDRLRDDREALELRLESIRAESERKQALFLSEYYLTLDNPGFGGFPN